MSTQIWIIHIYETEDLTKPASPVKLKAIWYKWRDISEIIFLPAEKCDESFVKASLAKRLGLSEKDVELRYRHGWLKMRLKVL